MKFKVHRLIIFAVTILVCIFVSWNIPIIAQEVTPETPTETAVDQEAVTQNSITTKNPAIPVEELKLLIKPLNLEELKSESESWMPLLRSKVQEISDEEIILRRQSSDLDKDRKKYLLEDVTKLQLQQTRLIERFNVVLDEIDAKGGDTKSYRQYISAVSGVALDITDAKGLSVRFLSWLKSPGGGIRLALGVLKIMMILLASIITANLAVKFIKPILNKLDWISVLFREFIVMMLKRGILAIGVLVALTSVGISLVPLLTLIGGVSFVLAFALQDNLGNFASGLMLLINKPFDVGDEIQVAGYWAFVDSISLANTKLKGFDGSMITLPNNTIWGGDIINLTHSDIRKHSITIYVKFTQDLEQIYEMWMKITSSHPKVLQTPSPSFFPWNGHYEYYIAAGLTAWSTTDDYWGVYVELLKELQKQVQARGIEMATPIQELKLSNSSPKQIAAQFE